MTVQEVYDTAIRIIDEQNELNGATDTADNAEYKFRTISIINTALAALQFHLKEINGYILKFDYKVEEPEPGKEPNFKKWIPIDDMIASSILPWYLAAHLVSTENTELANWCLNQYNANLEILKKANEEMEYKRKYCFERISTPYGLF